MLVYNGKDKLSMFRLKAAWAKTGNDPNHPMLILASTHKKVIVHSGIHPRGSRREHFISRQHPSLASW